MFVTCDKLSKKTFRNLDNKFQNVMLREQGEQKEREKNNRRKKHLFFSQQTKFLNSYVVIERQNKKRENKFL